MNDVSVGPVVYWSGWAWDGWTAIAAVAQLLAAIGTLGTLIYLARQLQAQRRAFVQELHHRRTEFHRSFTPVLSIQSGELVRTRVRCIIMLQIAAEGSGSAYEIMVDCNASDGRTYLHREQVGSMAAKQRMTVQLPWPPDVGASRPERIGLVLRYQNHFAQEVSVGFTGTITKDSVVFAGPPVYVWPDHWFGGSTN